MTATPLPTHTGLSSLTIRQVNVDAVSRSPFTGKEQVLTQQGEWWEADITLPPMVKSDARLWISFLTKMKGRVGLFTMGDPDGSTPQGEAGGTPRINGSGQTGSSIKIDGCTVAQSGWLLAGDYVQIGEGSSARLHMLTEDADTSGSGGTTLILWPSVRTAPVDNATVRVSSPVGAWRLITPVSSWDINAMTHYGMMFSARSVV